MRIKIRPAFGRFAVLLAVLAAVVFVSQSAHADPSFTFTITPDGSNLDVTGTGSFDLTGAGQSQPMNLNPQILADYPIMESGPLESSIVEDGWNTASGPAGIGTGYATAVSGTGSFVGFVHNSIAPTIAVLELPPDYVSGDPLTTSSVYENTTYATLGLTAGASYTWTWTAGTDTNTVNINIAAVPEPSTLILPTLAAALPLLRRRRNRP